MYYRNFSIGYNPNIENVCILKYDRDMTEFENSDFNRADHIVAIYSFPTFKFENYKYHLDENELLLGVFPPEFIEDCIQEYYVKLEMIEKKRKEQIKEQVKVPIFEDEFKKFKDNNFSLREVINYINIVNEFNLSHNGINFSIEEYYKDVLIKYWGCFKV